MPLPATATLRAAIAVALMLVGCAAPRPDTADPAPAPEASSPSSAPPAELADATWRWVETVTPVERISVDAPDRYTLRFGADGRVAVRADCNRGSGSTGFAADGRLSLGPIVLTKMACPPGSLSARFARDLDRVAVWFLRDGELYLELPVDSGTLRFRK